MDDTDRCNEEFWDTRCDQPRGHRTVHTARKGAARISWGNPNAGASAAGADDDDQDDA